MFSARGGRRGPPWWTCVRWHGTDEGGLVIPTLILFGLVFGRWWKSSLLVGTLGWTALLLVDDVIHVPGEVLGAAGLGLVNTLVGVAVHQLAVRSFGAWLNQRHRSSRHHPA